MRVFTRSFVMLKRWWMPQGRRHPTGEFTTEKMNISLALWGWLIWTVGNFVLEKDNYDDLEKVFPYHTYFWKNFENWIFNLLVATGLIFFGIKGLGLDAIPIGDFSHLRWNDAYYAGSGPIGEILMKYIKKFKKAKANE